MMENNNIQLENSDIDIFDDVEEAEAVSPLDVSDNINLKTIEPGDFIHTDLVPVKKIKCIVPSKLLKNIKSIEKCVNSKLGGTPEFSIYIHGEFDTNGNFVVGEKFYIPKQNVGSASVDYLEDPDPYYNGCLHKHPDGCKSFSGTDDKYINSNFEFSLLYVCKNISKGIINLKYHSTYRLQTELNVVIDDEDENVEFDITNINKNIPKTPKMFSTPAIASKDKVILPHITTPSLFQTDPEIAAEFGPGDLYGNFEF